MTIKGFAVPKPAYVTRFYFLVDGVGFVVVVVVVVFAVVDYKQQTGNAEPRELEMLDF